MGTVPLWMEKLRLCHQEGTDGQKAEWPLLPRLSTMGAHVHPHLGVCLWLWLGITLGLGQEQGKEKGWGLSGD